MITFVMALALAAPNPATIDAPRRAFQACLKTFESNQRKAKIAADAYSTAVKSACSAEAQALTDALVRFDTAMGTKRPAAMSNAQRDVDDYRLTSEERYRDLMSQLRLRGARPLGSGDECRRACRLDCRRRRGPGRAAGAAPRDPRRAGAWASIRRARVNKLEAALAGLPLTLRRSECTSGFIAVLEGERPGRTVLLRGDMDALPIHEATGLDFASREAGKMHACGHDSHSAMLASAARILCGKREQTRRPDSVHVPAGRGRFSRRTGDVGGGAARQPAARGRVRAAHLADAAARRGRLSRRSDARFYRHAQRPDHRQRRSCRDAARRARPRTGRGGDRPGPADQKWRGARR